MVQKHQKIELLERLGQTYLTLVCDDDSGYPFNGDSFILPDGDHRPSLVKLLNGDKTITSQLPTNLIPVRKIRKIRESKLHPLDEDLSKKIIKEYGHLSFDCFTNYRDNSLKLIKLVYENGLISGKSISSMDNLELAKIAMSIRIRAYKSESYYKLS